MLTDDIQMKYWEQMGQSKYENMQYSANIYFFKVAAGTLEKGVKYIQIFKVNNNETNVNEVVPMSLLSSLNIFYTFF